MVKSKKSAKKAIAIPEVKGKKPKTRLQAIKDNFNKKHKLFASKGAKKELVLPDIPVSESIEPVESVKPIEAVKPVVKDEVVAAKAAQPVEANFYFGAGDKTQNLVGQTGSLLNITTFGEPQFSAKDWHLVVKEIEVINLESKVGKAIKLPENMNRGILIGPDGYRLDFSNIDKITVAKVGAKSPKTQEDNHLFLMGVPSPATGWIVVVESSKVLDLDKADGFIVLNPENSGILIGPNGALLNFTKISAIKLPV